MLIANVTKRDFLFIALIFQAIKTFSRIFNKVGIIGKPRSSGILQWKIFCEKKNQIEKN